MLLKTDRLVFEFNFPRPLNLFQVQEGKQEEAKA